MPVFNTKDFNTLNSTSMLKTGDKFIVEDENGTNIIDFNFLILQKDNASFYTVVETISAALTPLSAQVLTLKTKLSSAAVQLTDVSFSNFTSSLTSEYQRIFYRSGTLFITAGSIVSNDILFITPLQVKLSASDVNMGFTTNTFAAISGRLVNVFPTLINTSGLNDYLLRANLTDRSTTNTIIYYNIFRPY